MKQMAFGVALAVALSAPAAAQTIAALVQPPSGWVAVDPTSMKIPDTTVLVAWREPTAPTGQFAENINVSYEPYAGSLQAFGDASVTQIQAMYPDATFQGHGMTTACDGLPAYTITWSATIVPSASLHFDQVLLKTAHGVEFATYTRVNEKPANTDALAAMKTFCQPVEPAAEATPAPSS